MEIISSDIQSSRGRFIAFEGIDGSGKSTQIQLFADKLRQKGILCETTMEPTEGPVGTMIRQVLTGKMQMDGKVIAALFAADRLDHLLNASNGIVAKVEKGITVLTDRYYFSSYAYHSVDMPMDWVIRANELSSNTLRPTVTLFIDVDPDIAMERITRNRTHLELFEERSRLVKVREKYLEAFEKLKSVENVLIIDGNRPLDVVAKDIWERIGG
jgi:dTMP kinase